MGITLYADEIFEIAEQIERNGAAFYRKAAERFDDLSARNRLLDLATMEDNHEKKFAEMRMEFSPGETLATSSDPDQETTLFLRAAADGKVFDIGKDPLDVLTGEFSVRSILKKAIELEKDSIVFYTGIREMVPKDIDKKRVTGIINEEIGHIVDLSTQLSSL